MYYTDPFRVHGGEIAEGRSLSFVVRRQEKRRDYRQIQKSVSANLSRDWVQKTCPSTGSHSGYGNEPTSGRKEPHHHCGGVCSSHPPWIHLLSRRSCRLKVPRHPTEDCIGARGRLPAQRQCYCRYGMLNRRPTRRSEEAVSRKRTNDGGRPKVVVEQQRDSNSFLQSDLMRGVFTDTAPPPPESSEQLFTLK